MSSMPSTLAMCADVRSLSITAATPVRTPFGAAHHRNAAAAARDDDGAAPHQHIDQRDVDRYASASATAPRGASRGRNPRASASRVRRDTPCACSSVKNGPIGLVGLLKAGSLGSTSTCVSRQATWRSLSRLAQRVLQRLHQQIGDAALAVRDADVERHRRNAVARQHLPHQDLADHRPVAVRDDEFVVELAPAAAAPAAVRCGDDLLLLARCR